MASLQTFNDDWLVAGIFLMLESSRFASIRTHVQHNTNTAARCCAFEFTLSDWILLWMCFLRLVCSDSKKQSPTALWNLVFIETASYHPSRTNVRCSVNSICSNDHLSIRCHNAEYVLRHFSKRSSVRLVGRFRRYVRCKHPLYSTIFSLYYSKTFQYR